MDVSQATEVFTLLTIGDGLVSQIPALIISTAAGIIATRNTNDDALGAQIGKQFKVHPKAIYITAGVLFVFHYSWFPKVSFYYYGINLPWTAYKIEQSNAAERTRKDARKQKLKKVVRSLKILKTFLI